MPLTESTAERLARMALDCIHREYPNKIAHVLHSDADVRTARELTPAFYGCLDWHSAVHGHWMLARLTRLFPNASFTAEARAVLEKSITPENLAAETRYLDTPGRESFERPYGLAWLLTLAAELRQAAPALAPIIFPLESAAWTKLHDWIRKLSRPDRSGQHANTAFALGLILDSAIDRPVLTWFERASEFYAHDRNGPMAFEPSGEDFLSPCLAEADLMRRLYSPNQFALWLTRFFPDFLDLKPEQSPDRADGKLAHLDGLNLSRAWMLRGIANGLPINDSRRRPLQEMSEIHRQAGLAAIASVSPEQDAPIHYAGSHWLGTFAVYLETGGC